MTAKDPMKTLIDSALKSPLLDQRVRELEAQMRELLEASRPVLDELVQKNGYDRRDVRFPSKAESAFRHALTKAEALMRPAGEPPKSTVPEGFVTGGPWTEVGRKE